MQSCELKTEFVGENLKYLREYGGFKTLEIAYFLNLTSTAYSYYEMSRSVPPLGKLIKLATFYDMTIEKLFYKPSELMAHLEKERKLADVKRMLELTEEQMELLRGILED